MLRAVDGSGVARAVCGRTGARADVGGVASGCAVGFAAGFAAGLGGSAGLRSRAGSGVGLAAGARAGVRVRAALGSGVLAAFVTRRRLTRFARARLSRARLARARLSRARLSRARLARVRLAGLRRLARLGLARLETRAQARASGQVLEIDDLAGRRGLDLDRLVVVREKDGAGLGAARLDDLEDVRLAFLGDVDSRRPALRLFHEGHCGDAVLLGVRPLRHLLAVRLVHVHLGEDGPEVADAVHGLDGPGGHRDPAALHQIDDRAAVAAAGRLGGTLLQSGVPELLVALEVHDLGHLAELCPASLGAEETGAVLGVQGEVDGDRFALLLDPARHLQRLGVLRGLDRPVGDLPRVQAGQRSAGGGHPPLLLPRDALGLDVAVTAPGTARQYDDDARTGHHPRQGLPLGRHVVSPRRSGSAAAARCSGLNSIGFPANVTKPGKTPIIPLFGGPPAARCTRRGRRSERSAARWRA
ncbi:pentapeptide repeat-containing protein [Streptomyces sp. NPDC096176]|uniref:pentapeptide repeat-containing protein n=1 Tax=Streptomyces sp. NPDC096176 TaxID=3366079 RepID=UPI00381A00E3